MCKPHSHAFWAWSRVKVIRIDDTVVITSDSESGDPCSISARRISIFFSYFFLLEVATLFFVFSLYFKVVFHLLEQMIPHDLRGVKDTKQLLSLLHSYSFK